MYDTYYDINLKKRITRYLLCDIKKYPTDDDALRALGVFPIRINRPIGEYDTTEYDLVPNNELVFNTEDQVYDQNFSLIELDANTKAQRKADAQIATDKARKEAILKELDAIDSKSARASRAVALSVATGTTPNSDDVSKLQEYENAANALRNELAEINQRLPKDPETV